MVDKLVNDTIFINCLEKDLIKKNGYYRHEYLKLRQEINDMYKYLINKRLQCVRALVQKDNHIIEGELYAYRNILDYMSGLNYYKEFKGDE